MGLAQIGCKHAKLTDLRKSVMLRTSNAEKKTVRYSVTM
ncbi:unnamed protein product, partial [Didymodactylos carnosus]